MRKMAKTSKIPQTRKRFGQHFLESVWADKVIRAIAPQKTDRFLEIGPGQGVLTLRLAPLVDQLLAIEIDRDLVASLTPRLPANASLISGDVLEAALPEVLAGLPDPIRIAGNLPYNISSPIIFRVLELQARRQVLDATFMLQREVAVRIAAHAGSKDYGVLSVLVQWQADVERLLELPPGAFRPPPAVRSSLLRLRFRPPRAPVREPAVFERLVRGIFTKRRKTMSNALADIAAESGLRAPQVLAEAEIDGRRRPETLEIVEMARLADVLSSQRK
jgi:16S rRNA (adenine1518-N6/adenine1519-N6)-dimethyltransferase